MINLPWMLAAAVAAVAGIAVPAEDFPCDTLSNGTLEVYDRIEESAAPVLGAVDVRKKAILFERRQALIAQLYTLADNSLATGADAARPILFRKYRSGADISFCAQTRNEALFGAGDIKMQFMLRCLIDRDGDGAYESFVHKAQLVPYNMRTGRTSAPTQEAPGILSLPRPVTLVPTASPARTDPFSNAEILTRISVGRVDNANVEIRFSGGVRRGPASLADRLMGTETIVAVPMTESEVTVLGTRIRFVRGSGKWTAAVVDGFGRPPRLQCQGAVIETGDTFTIMTPGGQQTVARADLRPRP